MVPQKTTRDGVLFDTLLLLWLANVLDAVLTVVGVSSGKTREANPLMAVLIDIHPSLFVVTKLLLMSGVCWSFWRFRRRHPQLTMALSGVAAGAYLLVCLWHIYVMSRVL